MLTRLLTSHTTIFFLGALSVAAGGALIQGLGHLLRPVAKGTIKSGIILGTRLNALGQEIKEDIEDLSAEAAAELVADNQAAAQKSKGPAKGSKSSSKTN